MDFCSLLPLPDDLWHKPHIYAWIGFFIGGSLGFFGPHIRRLDAKLSATFGTTAAFIFGFSYSAFFGGLGMMAGQIVALVVVGFCKG